MSNEQVLMTVILAGVGGTFLMGFLLIRRWLDTRRAGLERRLGDGDASINLGGEVIRHDKQGGRRAAGDSGIGLGDSGMKLGGGSGIALEDSGARSGLVGRASSRSGFGQPRRQSHLGLGGSGSQPGHESGGRGAATVRGGPAAVRPGKATAGPIVIEDALSHQPKGLGDRVDRAFNRMVERTGLAWSPEQALGIICLAGVLTAGGLYLWKEQLSISLIGLAIGFAIPLAMLMYLQSRWHKQLQEQMPDAFFFLGRSLRAGLSLEQALAVSGTQGAKPLADEFRRCSERVRLGLPAPTALALTAKRINLLDFNVFVSIVALHQTTGGNLAVQLDRLAASVRDRNQYQGYFRSATALGKISAVAIGAAVPVIFLGYTLFQPEFALRFFESATGLTMLATAFGLEIIGVFWLYLLLKINYQPHDRVGLTSPRFIKVVDPWISL